MFAAVQQSAPTLLPMVQWAYGGETPLHVVGTPSGMSQRRVGPRNPLGPLLFVLTLHRVLERADSAYEKAQLVTTWTT